jgi:hypothetical protein
MHKAHLGCKKSIKKLFPKKQLLFCEEERRHPEQGMGTHLLKFGYCFVDRNVPEWCGSGSVPGIYFKNMIQGGPDLSDETTKYADIEETLFSLIRSADMDQGNLLVLLSLVNMMGLINIISHRAGITKKHDHGMGASASLDEENEGAPEDGRPARDAPFDPAPLLSMLGGKQGPGLHQGHLEGLLKRFMGPPAAQQGEAAREGRQNVSPPSEGGEKEKTN